MSERIESCEDRDARLIAKLVMLLDSDSSNRRAAEFLLQAVELGDVEPIVAMRCHREAIREVYFSHMGNKYDGT